MIKVATITYMIAALTSIHQKSRKVKVKSFVLDIKISYGPNTINVNAQKRLLINDNNILFFVENTDCLLFLEVSMYIIGKDN